MRGGSSSFPLACVFAIAFSAFPRLGCSPETYAPGVSYLGPDRPRVVVLISIDTLRPDHLGVYGYDRFTSPVLDALAEEGAVFEDVSATAPWTLPSHASMLTGLYPMSHGVLTSRTKLPPGVPTLATIFGGDGFETAAVVNVVWLKKEDYELTRDFSKYQWVRTNLARKSASTWVTDAAIEWLSNLGDGRMFLFMHYYDVHSDYASEPAYEKLFVSDYDGPADGTTWQLRRASLEDDYLASCRDEFDEERCTFGGGEYAHVVDASVEKIRFDSRDMQHLRDLYDAQIRQLDAELGRFVAALRRLELLDETLLVVTSDHGEEFMEHGRLEHFLTTHQESLRVPLLLRGPGVPAGRRVSAPVSSVDLAPTLLALAGVETDVAFDGLDLRPLLMADPSDERAELAFADRYLYGEASGGYTYNFFAGGFFPVYRSVRRGPFKLVHDAKRNSFDLYDLANDPTEQREISGREPEVKAQLVAEMARRYRRGLPEADPADPVKLSPDDVERLRALGYVP